MKRKIKLMTCSITLLVFILFGGCNKEGQNENLPEIATDYIEVLGTQMSMVSTLSSDGGSGMKSRGFCFDTKPDVTINNNPVFTTNSNGGYGLGQETWIQFNLLPNTTYYVRAFAENSNGVGYGEELSITTGPVFEPDDPTFDIEGNPYTTVKIGSQVWMVENLMTRFYNDGSPIPYVPDEYTWGKLDELDEPAYCWLYNDAGNKEPYGALYNWKVVQTGKLAPLGWRVPTDDDWNILFRYLGGNVDYNFFAGAKMKEAGTAHWSSPNGGATNASGWTGLPGMYRHSSGYFLGLYPDLNTPWSQGFWWSSTSSDPAEANFIDLSSGGSGVWISHINRFYGFSVRCIRDY